MDMKIRINPYLGDCLDLWGAAPGPLPIPPIEDILEQDGFGLDAQAMAGDWRRVGDYLRQTMNKVRDEQKEVPAAR